MAKKFQHFVLTRFNLRMAGWGNIHQWIGGDENYLSYRFYLFEHYCIPSMRNQKGDFLWLVFFSSMTPAKFKDKAKSYCKSFPSYVPVFVNDEQPLDNFQAINQAIRDRLSRECEYYITTRIDNDDAFNLKTIRLIAEKAEQTRSIYHSMPYVISCVNGYAYNQEMRFIQRYSWDQNHFLSLICSDKKMCDHVLNYAHDKIKETSYPIVLVEDDGCWLEIVNGSNLCNKLRLYCSPRYRSKKWLKKNFNIEENLSFGRFIFSLLFFFMPAKVSAFLTLWAYRFNKLFRMLWKKDFNQTTTKGM